MVANVAMRRTDFMGLAVEISAIGLSPVANKEKRTRSALLKVLDDRIFHC